MSDETADGSPTGRLTNASRLMQGKLVAVVAAPHNRDGALHESALSSYMAWVAKQALDGVAIWTPLGHGLTSPAAEREAVFTEARRQLAPGKIILCGAGCSNEDVSAPEVGIKLSTDLAEDAARLGASAVLAYPPTFLRGMALLPCRDSASADGDPDDILADWVEEYHQSLASAGIPLVACFLSAASGGFHYDNALRQRILSLEAVQAVNFSTPDSDTPLYDWNKAQAPCPEKLLIAGADELLARSILIGARAVLSPVASAFPALVRCILTDFTSGDQQAYVAHSVVFNRVADLVCNAPHQNAGRRLLFLLAEQGIIPGDAVHDPWSPELPPGETAALRSLVRELQDLPEA